MLCFSPCCLIVKIRLLPVRIATLNDIPRLADLWQEKTAVLQQFDRRVGAAPDGMARWSAAAAGWLNDPRCAVFVIETNKDASEKVAGYVIGWIQPNTPGLMPEQYGVITDIAFDMHDQRGGQARELLGPLRDWFAAQGISAIVAQVSSRSVVEQAFWRSLGATEWVDLMWLKL